MAKHKEPWERELLERAVERQMRWRNLTEKLADEVEARRTAEELGPRLGPYIAVSRQSGAGGSEIGRLVGEKLGWKVLDKQIVEFMAEQFHLDRNILGMLDETKTNWINETLGGLLDRRLVSQDAYVDHLGKMLLLACYQGQVVVVGRGAQFVLPRERGLAVRVVASAADRLHRVCQRGDLSEHDARQEIDEIDEGRAAFVRRYFSKDVSDPELYDLVVNSSSFGIENAAEAIVAAYRLRGLEGSS